MNVEEVFELVRERFIHQVGFSTDEFCELMLGKKGILLSLKEANRFLRKHFSTPSSSSDDCSLNWLIYLIDYKSVLQNLQDGWKILNVQSMWYLYEPSPVGDMHTSFLIHDELVWKLMEDGKIEKSLSNVCHTSETVEM